MLEPVASRHAARSSLIRLLAEQIVADYIQRPESATTTIKNNESSNLRPLQHRQTAGNLDR
jgi:hypothetical protein